MLGYFPAGRDHRESKMMHNRMGEQGCPSGEQSYGEKWTESWWSISCFVVCHGAQELGAFVAPSPSDCNS